jgi:hypothetical protein
VVKTKGAALALLIAEQIKPADKTGAIREKIALIFSLVGFGVMINIIPFHLSH